MDISSGTEIGPYRIISPIGAGGMGEVYSAQDTRLDRVIALKILPADDVNDVETTLRFVREVKAASVLSHPNIAHVYEIGTFQDLRFIAMEYVQGRTLDEFIKERSLQTAEIIDIGTQIADALEEAHSKEITHRDIKPANIMISQRGQVKVLDFGLAKFVKPANGVASSKISTVAKTNPGLVLGTVHYMSPEQALGRNIDQRSDIFSLGVVLYELSTGKLPFPGESTSEILDRILHSQPESIARFNYNLPSELERIIRKCLEKDANRRYQSVRELLVDLRNLKRDTDSHISGAAPATSYSTRFRLSRVFAVTMALAITTFVILWIYRQYGNTQEILSIAVLPFLNATGNPENEYLSDGITESTINSLSRFPQLKVMALGTVFAYKGKNMDPRKVGRDLKVDAIVTASLYRRGDSMMMEVSLARVADGIQLWGNQFQKPLSNLTDIPTDISRELSEKLRLKLTGEEKSQATTHTGDSEAYRLYLKGRYFWNKRTAEGLNKAIEFFQQAIEKDPNYALAYSGLADSYGLIGEDSQQIAAAFKAVELDDSIAEVHVSLAGVKSGEWDWAGEEQEYRKAIQLNPNHANAHVQYGDLLAATGQLSRAIEEMRLANELDPLSLHISTVLGTVHAFARRYDESIQQLRKTFEMDPNYPQARATLAWVYLMQGLYMESIDEDEKAFVLYGEKPEEVERTSRELREAYQAKKARGYWEKRLQVISNQKSRIKRRPLEMALCYAHLGRKDEAFQLLEMAYEQKLYKLIFGGSYIKVNPLWDPLRSDPRFTDLLKRCNLMP